VDAQPAALTAFALTRLKCSLAGAPLDVIKAWSDPETGYAKNRAPALNGLALIAADGAGTTLAPDQTPVTVPSGAAVTLSAALAADASETYPWFDRDRQVLEPRRESLSLSWFTSAGEFSSDRTGRGESETAAESRNRWIAPVVTAPTTVHLWLVLRDSRGGVDFAAYDLIVAP
jgi:hypothetical protein